MKKIAGRHGLLATPLCSPSATVLLLLAAGCGDGGGGGGDASSADLGPSSAAKVSCKVDKVEAASTTGSLSSAVVSGSKTPHSNSVPLMPGQDKAIGGMIYGSSQGCSGTLVADRAVLTASHCVVKYYLWDGSNSTYTKYTMSPSEVAFGVGTDMKNPTHLFKVKEIHVNPMVSMTYNYIENDNALLILEESATEKVPGIVPIPVNLESIATSEVGKTVEQGGFGSLTCNTYDFSPIRYFSKMELYKVMAKDIGVKSVAGSPSMGDSGSGLLLRRSDGRTHVASVLSLSADDSCGYFAGPRIDVYGQWLSGLLEDSCGSTTSKGSCVKGVAIWCEGNEILSQDCTAAKKSCGADACGLYRCIDTPASTDERCQGLDYFGRCNGDVAEWCLSGQFKHRNCAAFKQTCAKSSSPWVGYTCSGSTSDAGAGDKGSGKDAAWPDFRIGTASCSAVDDCLTACGNDFWCQYACYYEGTGHAKELWSEWTWCLYCSAYEDKTFCDTSSSFYAKCVSECTTQTSTACQTCWQTTCGDKEKTCKADQKEAGGPADATPTDAGAQKEAGSPNG
jgi:hypothetical protein